MDYISEDADVGTDSIEYIEALDKKFEAEMPEPSSSTASMIAYAEAYLDLWQGEIDALISTTPKLSDEFSAFQNELGTELEALADEYASGDGALYGSAVSYELIWYKATALRDWLSEHYS